MIVLSVFYESAYRTI